MNHKANPVSKTITTSAPTSKKTHSIYVKRRASVSKSWRQNHRN